MRSRRADQTGRRGSHLGCSARGAQIHAELVTTLDPAPPRWRCRTHGADHHRPRGGPTVPRQKSQLARAVNGTIDSPAQFGHGVNATTNAPTAAPITKTATPA